MQQNMQQIHQAGTAIGGRPKSTRTESTPAGQSGNSKGLLEAISLRVTSCMSAEVQIDPYVKVIERYTQVTRSTKTLEDQDDETAAEWNETLSFNAAPVRSWAAGGYVLRARKFDDVLVSLASTH